MTLDSAKKAALFTDFLFIFGVLLSIYRGLQQCFHFALSSNLWFYGIMAGLLVVSLGLWFLRWRILTEEQFCLNTLIGEPPEEQGNNKKFEFNKYMLIATGLSLLAYMACQSFFVGASLLSSPHWLSLSLVCMILVVAVCYSIDQHYNEKTSYQGGLCEDIIANRKDEYANKWGSKLHILWAFLLFPLTYGVFQVSIPGVTLFGNPHWLSIAAAVIIFTFFMCHLHSFHARKTVQRWANWFINFSFFYYTSQVFSTLALQTTFGALISNPWGFLLLFLGGAIPATIVFINERVHEEEQLCIELLGADFHLEKQILKYQGNHYSWQNDQETYSPASVQIEVAKLKGPEGKYWRYDKEEGIFKEEKNAQPLAKTVENLFIPLTGVTAKDPSSDDKTHIYEFELTGKPYTRLQI